MKETKVQDDTRQTFLKAAEKIKSLGYKVFVTKEKSSSYGYFSDGDRIGYFQLEAYHSGITFATTNKTPPSHGMHYLTEVPAWPVPLKDISDEILKKAFAEYPDYFSGEEKKNMLCQKYNNLDDFRKSWHMQELMEI